MDCANSKSTGSTKKMEVRIREYDETMDLRQADELEKQCEAGPGGSASLYTDLLGDPLCRVRQYPAFAMLVAETQADKELVGLVRAGVKVVCVPQHAARVSHSSEGSPCKSEQSMASDVDTPSAHGHQSPLFVSIAYILGLRVAPKCRRLGIGAALVKKMEEWCSDRGAEYVYIATEKDNEASVGLFTKKLGYVEFRNPAILVQPIYVRHKKLSKKVQIVELSTEEACKLYSNVSIFGQSEFLPKDIEDVVKSKLHKGTWLAFWKEDDHGGGGGGHVRKMRYSGFGSNPNFANCFSARGVDCREADADGRNMKQSRLCYMLDSIDLGNPVHGSKEHGKSGCDRHKELNKLNTVCDLGLSTYKVDPSIPSDHSPILPASSWAVLSVWKCNEIYQLEMKGAPLRTRAAAAASRVAGRILSKLLSIPTMPDVFKPFGLQLIYGLHAHGPGGPRLARHLCWLAHNLAKDDGCAVVAAEVASSDPLRHNIPHWTCDEDMWCIKRLTTAESPSSSAIDWSNAPPSPLLFLDPRDF